MYPYVAASASSSTATVNTNHVVTLPTGIVAGDLILILMDIGSTLATLNAHADYTELLDESAAHGLKILYRQAVGGETNPTLVSSATTRDATITLRISNHIAPGTQAPQVGTTATGSSTTPNPPSLTPTGGAKDYLWIAMFGRDGEAADDTTWVTASPTGFDPTDPISKACGTVGTNLGGLVAAAWAHENTATKDPGTFTCTTGAWRAQTIAVHPANTGPYWEIQSPVGVRGY